MAWARDRGEFSDVATDMFGAVQTVPIRRTGGVVKPLATVPVATPRPAASFTTVAPQRQAVNAASLASGARGMSALGQLSSTFTPVGKRQATASSSPVTVAAPPRAVMATMAQPSVTKDARARAKRLDATRATTASKDGAMRQPWLTLAIVALALYVFLRHPGTTSW